MTDKTTQQRLKKRIDEGGEAFKWWGKYCDATARDRGPGSRSAPDPAIRAQLRRCGSNLDALGIPAAMTLLRRLDLIPDRQALEDERFIAGLGLARVLAHVDEHDSKRAMQAAGWKSFPGDRRESDAGDDRPLLSEARFRRLLQTGNGEEQVTAFIRLIKILDRRASVPAIAKDFLHWSDRTKQSWAFDYYAAGIAAPSDPTTTDEE